MTGGVKEWLPKADGILIYSCLCSGAELISMWYLVSVVFQWARTQVANSKCRWGWEFNAWFKLFQGIFLEISTRTHCCFGDLIKTNWRKNKKSSLKEKQNWSPYVLSSYHLKYHCFLVTCLFSWTLHALPFTWSLTYNHPRCFHFSGYIQLPSLF